MLEHVKQRQAAKSFSKTWKGRGYEKGESAPFCDTIIFGHVDTPYTFGLVANKYIVST